MEQWQALDEVLQRLNGLDNDSEKRAHIIQYIKKEKTIAIFAYGSLMWSPINHVTNTIRDCTLHGYTKGFFCRDFIYRGTTDCMGLTMGLKSQENSFVKGDILISDIDQMISFLQAFVERETPIHTNGMKMDIYTYDFLPVTQPDGESTKAALTCVVNCNSEFYVRTELSIEEQAEIIGRSYGINGTNFQYLHKIMDEYRRRELLDTKTEEMEELCKAVLLFRQHLVEQDRQWLEMFDRLATEDERQIQILLRRNNTQIPPGA
jgi:cation transport regulator ChaC